MVLKILRKNKTDEMHFLKCKLVNKKFLKAVNHYSIYLQYIIKYYSSVSQYSSSF